MGSNNPLIAVVDVETTGINYRRHERVIEVASVVITPQGEVVREFCSLVNPDRDLGAIGLHGIAGEDLVDAPTFGDIAGPLLESLRDTVAFAAHNATFDFGFVEAELSRLGLEAPDIEQLCTLRLSGGEGLESACDTWGVTFNGTAHCALDDARATAALLVAIMSDDPDVVAQLQEARAASWPSRPAGARPALTRDAARSRPKPHQTFMQRLLRRTGRDFVDGEEHPAILAYIDMLDRVLEDRSLSADELKDLEHLADHHGIPGALIDRVHRGYLVSLVREALADSKITPTEQADLSRVADLLGLGGAGLAEATAIASRPAPRAEPAEVKPDGSLVGQKVCFTGECVCTRDGEPITRETATKLATAAGLEVVGGVTKKLNILVVADPNSRSGKAKKAREYGTRIMHEPVFWKAIGVEVE